MVDIFYIVIPAKQWLSAVERGMAMVWYGKALLRLARV